MKKFRKNIDQYILNVEQKWKALPEKRQRLFTKVFLAGYTLLTIAAFVQIWWNAAHSEPIPIGGHISNIPTGIVSMNQSVKTPPIIGAGLIVHSKKGNYMLYSLEYSREVIPYRTSEIPVETFNAEAGYSLNLIGNQKKSLMLNATLSAVAGYESFNRGEHLLDDGSALMNESSFVYGAGGRLSAEIYLSDRFIIIAAGRTKILWNNFRNQFTPSIGIGVRINL